MGAAAAVLIVVAVAFASNLPGPIKRMTHLGHESIVSPPSLQGTGASYRGTTKATPSDSHTAVAPSSSPSPTSSASPPPSASGLCQSYFGYFTHPESEDSWATEMSLYWRLTKLARSSDPSQVFRYCSPYLGDRSSRGWHYQGMYHWQQGNAGQDSQSQTGAASEAPQGHSGPGGGSAPPAQGSQNGAGSGQGSQNGGPAAQDPSPVSPSPVSPPAP
jgi:hypothetical protein